jgi:hypothetical protein
MPMIRTEAIRSAVLQREPFRWSHVDGLFSDEDLRLLSCEFPSDQFVMTRRETGSDKRYVTAARPLRDRSGRRHGESGLTPAWRMLLEALCSPVYAEALGALTGEDVRDHVFDIGCFRYGPGGFVSPHTDKEQKSIGHVLYFNPDWDPAWGGVFRILDRPDERAVRAEIPPLAGQSVVLVRSDRSWHCVTPVIGPAERLAVHVDFWRFDPAERPGRVIVGMGNLDSGRADP